MPTILNSPIGEIHFPDGTPDEEILSFARDRLPAMIEGSKRGRTSDFFSRLGYEPAIAVANEIETAGNLLRKIGAASAMSAPPGMEHAILTGSAEVAERMKKYADESRQNARDFYTPNPLYEDSLPTKAIRGVSATAPKLLETIALQGASAPAIFGAIPKLATTTAGRMVPAMLSAGTVFGVTPEGEFSPKEAAIAAGTVPAFGLGEALASKIISKLPIKNVHFELSPEANATMREAQAIGSTIEQAPEGFTAKVTQKIGGLPVVTSEAVRKALEQTGGILAANTYLTAVQAPEILKMPPEQRKAAIADLVVSQAAMSLLGYLPVLQGEPSNAYRTIWERIAKEAKQKYGAEPGSEPPPAAGLPAPGPARPTPGSPVAPAPDALEPSTVSPPPAQPRHHPSSPADFQSSRPADSSGSDD